MLLDLALPSFLSPRNLPALSNLAESRFLILTTPKDRARIEESPIFKRLKAVIEPVFVDSPWIKQDIPYHLKAARGHRVAAEIAARGDGYCVYLCPDCLMSDGSFKYLEQQARLGKQAVLTPGLRLVQESVYAELTGAGRLLAGEPLTFSPRELVEFGLRHLHMEVQRHNWDHPCFAAYPNMCTWSVPGETGLLIRAFHLHPLLVSVRGAKDFADLEESTIDGEFLGRNVTDWDQIHVETDSDNLLIFSLTPKMDRYTPLEQNSAAVEKVRQMAYAPVCNPLHRSYFTKAIKLHAGDLNGNWTAVEQATAPLVYPILRVVSPEDSLYLRQVPLRNLTAEISHRIKRRGKRMLQQMWPFKRV